MLNTRDLKHLYKTYNLQAILKRSTFLLKPYSTSYPQSKINKSWIPAPLTAVLHLQGIMKSLLLQHIKVHTFLMVLIKKSIKKKQPPEWLFLEPIKT